MTMQFDANFIPATFAEAIFRIKQLLKSCGWVVQASSDGTTFSTTPGNVNDVITTAGAGAGGMANTLAWFVIKKPDSGAMFCFQRVDDATVYPAALNTLGYAPLLGFSANLCWRIKYTLFAPFTSGTPSAIETPTSVDEHIIVGGGTDAAPTFAVVPLYPDGDQTFTISADNAAPYGWWAGGYGYNLDGWFVAGGLAVDDWVVLDTSGDSNPDSLAHSPPAADGAMMAYDKARQRGVLFGGNFVDIQTWLWDGTDWKAATVSWNGSPRPRRNGAMAYDETRQEVVLFGGLIDNFNIETTPTTMIWNGVRWHPSTTVTTTPPARQQQSMVWSPAADAIIMFGGKDQGGTYLNDTWKWDGTDWSLLVTVGTPTACAGAGMGISPSNGRIIMFGGENGGVPNSQTYEFNTATNTWTLLAPGTIPPARSTQAMVTDTTNGKIVMLGGLLAGGIYDGATYTWNGTNWTLAVASPSTPFSLPDERAPSRRASAATCFDSDRARMVVHSGFPSGNDYAPWGFSNQTSNQTWLWNGTQWSVVRAIPSAGHGSQMVYDPVRQVLVWFGGYNDTVTPPNGATDRTWEFDGTKWTRIFPTTSPSARYHHSMAYDVANSRVVLFGGRDRNNSALSDTWMYNGVTWTNAVPVTTPATRFLHAMAWDGAGDRVILYGGYDGSPTLQSSTYSWNGSNWTLLAPANNPGTRESVAMCGDGTNVWLYGGYNGSIFPTDTWKWVGGNWVLQTFLPASLPRVGGSMWFDNARGVLAMAGGRNYSGFIPGPGYFWDRVDTVFGWQQETDFFEAPTGNNQGQALPYTGGSDGYAATAYDVSRSRAHFVHAGHHWYTGKFNGSASGFMFYDPIKNADPSDPDPYVVYVSQRSSPGQGFSGMQGAFNSSGNSNYPPFAQPFAAFFYGEAFTAENALWTNVGSPTYETLYGTIAGGGSGGGGLFGCDPAVGGNHLRLWPWVWLQTGGAPAGRGIKGESSFLHLPDRAYGYGGTSITVSTARDYMMHKVVFKTNNLYQTDQSRHAFAVPWNGSVPLNSVDPQGPYSGNTEFRTVADGSRSSIGVPIQAVTGSIIVLPSQVEVEVDPLLLAQDPLEIIAGGSGGGGVLVGSNILRGGG